MRITLHFVDLRLRETFRISRESRDVQPTLLLGLEQDGVTGWGEATLSKYYGITRERLVAAVARVAPWLEQQRMEEPALLWEKLHFLLGDEPFALCALDEAAYDLWGKLKGKSLAELWQLPAAGLPVTSYTLGIDTVPDMVKKLKTHPWPLYKIKLGTPQDMAIMEALRKHTDARFRVDANGGWTAEETILYSYQLRELGVEFIEQPLRPGEQEEMRQVVDASALPLIADESCQQESDVEDCLGYFHGINIKLTKCGGLTPARRMIAQARKLGMKVMVGCMTESSVGVSAAAQLLPLVDYADLDGPLLIANDPADGVKFDNQGQAVFPDRPGTGVVISQFVN